MERHRRLRQIARAAYRFAGIKSIAHQFTRFAIQRIPLSFQNKQHLYNFFSEDTAPGGDVLCRIRLTQGKFLELELDLRDSLSLAWYYWGYGNYERGTTQFFRELLRHNRYIFDIGANVGYYSLLAAAQLEGRGQVHSFEPNPGPFQWLYRSAGRNQFRCLHLNPVALSDKDGKGQLFLPATGDWSTASLLQDFAPQSKPLEIEAIRFDTYCRKFCIDRVDLVKIDVEGAESKVFHGMGELLETWRPDIICEVLEPYEGELNRFFSGKPYRKFLITDNGLEEKVQMKASSQWRDYYLSCNPIPWKTSQSTAYPLNIDTKWENYET